MKSSNRFYGGILILLVLLSTLSIFSLYNNAIAQPAQPTFEKIAVDAKTIRIQNSLKEPVLDIQLIENTDQCLADCHAIIRLRPYQRVTFPETPNDDFKWDFLKAAPNMAGLKSYRFQILENVSYAVSVPIFENKSYDCNPDNITGEYDACWEDVQTGSTQEARYSDEYVPSSFWGETLEQEKDYYIKLIGNKYPALGENSVDWIPAFYGIRIDDWAWWNGSWGACRNITIPATLIDNENLINFPLAIQLDSTNINYSKTQNSGADIRIVSAPCNAGGNVVPYEIEHWDESGESIVHFLSNIITGQNFTYSYYYYNAIAADAQNPAGVWNNSFLHVFHMRNDTATNIKESISGKNATIEQTNVTNAVFGQMDGSINVTSNGGVKKAPINATNAPTASSTTLTTLVFVKPWVLSAYAEYATRAYNVNLVRLSSTGSYINTCIYTGSTQTCDDAANYPLTKDSWYLLGVTYNGSHKVSWVNGSIAHYRAKADTVPARYSMYIGGTDGYSYYGRATIDEIVDSNVTRSATWINMTYKSWDNQLITYGDEMAYSETATESAGDAEIVNGIMNSKIYPGCSIYNDQQIYLRYLNGGQVGPGQFDRVAVYGNQTWAFNYVTTGESYTYMDNLSTTVYIWEKVNLTESDIRSQVSSLINATKV